MGVPPREVDQEPDVQMEEEEGEEGGGGHAAEGDEGVGGVKWRCDECRAVFEAEVYPVECPECGFYHCGDDECCSGVPFMVAVEES